MAGEEVPVDDLPLGAAVPESDLPESYRSAGSSRGAKANRTISPRTRKFISGEATTSDSDSSSQSYRPVSEEQVRRAGGALGRKARSHMAEILAQQDPDVDYSGIPDKAAQAAYSLLSKPEDKNAYLKQRYGEKNVTKDSYGHDVVIRDGKKVAFVPREAGKNLAAQYSALAGEVAPVTGMIGGGIAGAPLGPVGGMAFSAGGGGAGVALNQLIARALGLPVSQDSTEAARQIVTEGMLPGALGEGIARGAGYLGRTAVAPYRPGSILGPWERTRPMWEQQMADVEAARNYGLRPHVGTVAPNARLLMRFQSMANRVFGDELPQFNRPILESNVNELTGRAAGGSVEPGLRVPENLNLRLGQRSEGIAARADQEAARARSDAEGLIKKAQERLTQDIGAPRGDLSSRVTNDIRQARLEFGEKASALYKPLDELADKPVVPTAGIKSALRDILSEMPPTKSGEVSVLVPENLKAFAKGVEDLPDYVTFQQMQAIRHKFYSKSEVDALNAGLSDRQASQLAKAADQSFDDAVNTVREQRGIPGRSPEQLPDSLLAAVARGGGIRQADVGGELPDITRTPTWAKRGNDYSFYIVHNGPKAKSLDGMREYLVDQGYLRPNESIDDMLNAIREEAMQGKPTYFALQDQEKVIASQQRRMTGATGETIDSDAAIKALRRADAFYKAGIQRFDDLTAQALVKDATKGGYIEPERVARFIATPGDASKLLRIKRLLKPDTFAEVGRETWAQTVRDSIDPLTGQVDGRKLSARLYDLSKNKTLDILYGEKAPAMRRLAAQFAAMDGKIGTEALERGDMRAAIEGAIRKQKMADNLMRSDWLRSIRTDGPQSLQAADWLTRPDNRLQLRNAMKTIGPQSEEAKALREYLARRIFQTMEVEASKGAEKYAKTELMGEPLVRELDRYGRDYLSEVFGKEWTEKAYSFAKAAEIGTRKNPADQGGLVASYLALRPLKNVGRLIELFSGNEVLSSPLVLDYLSKGFANGDIAMRFRQVMMQGTRAASDIGTERGMRSSSEYARGVRSKVENMK